MATRRNRIKGIANIPQRRKVETKVTAEIEVKNESETNITSTFNSENVAQIITVRPEISSTAPAEEESESTILITNDRNVAHVSQTSEELQVSTKESVPSDLENAPTPISTEVLEPDLPNSSNTQTSAELNVSAKESLPSNLKSVPTSISTEVLELDPQNSKNSNTTTTQRRTFIKPKINLKSLSQKLKPNLTKIDLTHTDLKEYSISGANDSNTVCTPQLDQVPSSTSNQISDSVNITEPPSPTKIINRSRIKAVPRLQQRRISTTIHGSASESEDDTRKHFKRAKTDSICSTTSGTGDTTTKTDSDVPQQKGLNSITQKKCRRSEHANRMAEARRNFQAKFRNQTPEKKKLTMYDLIFYNPATKPMDKKTPQSERTEEDEPTTPTRCDSPSKNIESDEDSVPVPQIKIGKNGEIIIDEKSLIVENKQTKKDRETLKNSELVNGDFDTGYGIYKRVRRGKDWSKEETLFFYKALHTLGTDFSLMLQLFPGRTRRELKMKFKKEDRINHTLIDKALSQPLHFNIMDLKKEVELKHKMKELEEHQKEKRLKELKLANKNTPIPYSFSYSKRLKEERQKKKTQKSRRNEDLYSKLEKGIASVWKKSDDENGSSDSSCEVTVSNILKQTRYGRIPNKKKELPKTSTESATKQSQGLEPGSVMITCEPTPKGDTTFKVFMVTPTHTQVPIDFPSDVINTFAKTFTAANKETASEPIAEEHNYTICHDVGNEEVVCTIESNSK